MRTKHLLIGALVMTGCMPPAEPDSAGDPVASAAPAATSAAVQSTTTALPTPSMSAAAIGPLPGTVPSGQGMPEGKEAPLDSLAATKAAQAKGLKVSLFVPHPVKCPAIAKPTGDSTLLQAKGYLAGTIVDIDGFFRTDMGVPEAVALLGAPVLCNDGAVAGYLNMYLAPRDPTVRAVTLETHDGDLIGVIVEFEKTTIVDVTALERRFGKSRRMPGPLDSFEAGSDVFSVDGTAFSLQLMFAHRGHKEPIHAREVYQIIYRRTSMIEILPEGFHSTSDVARLVALALRAQAPEPVAFAGTLGLYNQPVDNRISFGPSLPIRNITSAAVGLRSAGEREFVQTLEVTFKAPIAGDVNAFARALGTALQIPTPTSTDDGKRKRLDIIHGGQKRGRVLLEWAAGGLRSIEIVRADGG